MNDKVGHGDKEVEITCSTNISSSDITDQLIQSTEKKRDMDKYFEEAPGKKLDMEKAAELQQRILEEYPEIFQGIGCFNREFHIDVNPIAQPRQTAPRKVPIAFQEPMKEELK